MKNDANRPVIKVTYDFRTFFMHRYNKRVAKQMSKALEYINYVAFYYHPESSLLARETLSTVGKKSSESLLLVERYLETYEIEYDTTFHSEQQMLITSQNANTYASFLIRCDRAIFKLEGLYKTGIIKEQEAGRLINNVKNALAKFSERIQREKQKLMNFKKKREQIKLEGELNEA